MAPAYYGLESVPPDLWTAFQASSNAEASILIASGSKEEFINIGAIDMPRPPVLTHRSISQWAQRHQLKLALPRST